MDYPDGIRGPNGNAIKGMANVHTISNRTLFQNQKRIHNRNCPCYILANKPIC